MKSTNSTQLLSGIDKAFADIKKLNTTQNASSTYLAHFLVVYICGIYEEIVETTIVEMVKKTGNNEVSNFIKETLDGTFRNPDWSKIRGLFDKFGNQYWISEMKSLPHSTIVAFNSIVTNKNSLAHGTSQLNLTVSDVEDYYLKSKRVIEKIDELLL